MVKNIDLFLADMRSTYGWAVAEQAEAVLKRGEPLSNQNPNALKLMFDTADKRNEFDFAEELADHLGIEYMPDDSKDPNINDMLTDADFLRMVDSKFGWAIHQAAKAILDDPSTIEDQNTNALKYIEDLASKYGRDDISIMILDYLEGM